MTRYSDGAFFDECIRRIDAGYHDLGHQLGWQFLYTPKSTFSRAAPMWFIGLNPGGSQYREPIQSFEDGNAYLIDRWGGRGRGGSLPGPNPLQRQIILLFQQIAKQLGTDHVEFMNSTLTANFCPYRSPSWDALASKKDSIRFCKRLWENIAKELRPRVIVTISAQASGGLVKSLNGIGFTVKNRERVPVGWGKVSGARLHLSSESGDVLLVRFPHFSRFPIIGRSESADAVCLLVDEIVSVAGS